MIVAIALQTRLLDAAERHLGATGESVLHSAAQTELNTPFERISYAQLPEFFAAIEHSPISSMRSAISRGSAHETDGWPSG
jgi:hypothetical protein